MLTAAMVVWWVDVPTVGVSPVGGVGSSERVSMWTSAVVDMVVGVTNLVA